MGNPTKAGNASLTCEAGGARHGDKGCEAGGTRHGDKGVAFWDLGLRLTPDAERPTGLVYSNTRMLGCTGCLHSVSMSNEIAQQQKSQIT